MQSYAILKWPGLMGIFLLVAFCGLAAEAHKTAEAVMLKEGKLLVVQDGKTGPVKETVYLPNEIKVTTNATFTVNKGKERHLKEGQVLDKEGMLTSADGSVEPVIDHVSMKNGKLWIFQDGERSALDHDILFPDGSKLVTDGTLRTREGQLKRVIDGELFKLNGDNLSTRDTISFQNGKVVVQKDGSLLTLNPTQTIMMNDGTKAYGNGTVQLKDGTKVDLTEGQILTVEGVVAPKK
jgi:hypothetical protein